MGSCSSKKAVIVIDPTSSLREYGGAEDDDDFSNLNNGPGTVISAKVKSPSKKVAGESRFQKAKIHANKDDPDAVFDEDVESEEEDHEEEGSAAEEEEGEDEDNEEEFDEEEDEDGEEDEDDDEEDDETDQAKQKSAGDIQDIPPSTAAAGNSTNPGQGSEDDYDTEVQDQAILQIIQQLAYPNLKLIEQYVTKVKHHDLGHQTMGGGFHNIPEALQGEEPLSKDYEMIPNRLHVPDEMANEYNPNIVTPS